MRKAQFTDERENLAFSMTGNHVKVLSIQSMVTFNRLRETCECLQNTANQEGKTTVTPLGMINRRGLYEPHCVLLVCRPGKRPLIVDSKSGSGYPPGIEVVNTGNQGFFDRQSCWAHTIQQSLHYAYQVEMGMSLGALEPYVG